MMSSTLSCGIVYSVTLPTKISCSHMGDVVARVTIAYPARSLTGLTGFQRRTASLFHLPRGRFGTLRPLLAPLEMSRFTSGGGGARARLATAAAFTRATLAV